MSLLGLVRHLAETERDRFRGDDGGAGRALLFCSDTDRDGDLDGAVPDPQVVAEAWEAWHAEVDFGERPRRPASKSRATIPLNRHRSGGGEMSLRKVLVGMIEDYARHMGHTDLLRERSTDASASEPFQTAIWTHPGEPTGRSAPG